MASSPRDHYYIRVVQQQTHEWRMEKWPSLTAFGQLFGTAIELMELGELLWKAKHYDEDWADDEELKREAGDVVIYFLGVISLLGFDVVECIDAALNKNEKRDWERHQQAPDRD